MRLLPTETPKEKSSKPVDAPKRKAMGEWTREESIADIDGYLATGKLTQDQFDKLRPYHETSWNPNIESGAKVGDAAPDGKAVNLDGTATSLYESISNSAAPVILCFGSVTCPPFRMMFAKQVMDIAEAFKDRVRLQFIYIKEAHPTDEWAIGVNVQHGVARPQCVTIEDRISAAKKLLELHPGLKDRLILDSMTNGLNEAYAAMSSRLYVVQEKRVVYQGHVGPYEFSPKSLKGFLETHLENNPEGT